MTPDDVPPLVGQQLAKRREDLDLTQELLARRIGITSATVSATERGRTAISRAKRSTWEQALRLAPGTITRAYRDGTPVEPLDAQAEQEPVYADLSDRLESAVWEMDALSVEDRKMLIDLLRQKRAQERGGRSA